jgi:uncharacterized protein (TIGR02452 family)
MPTQNYRSPAHEANALCFEDTMRLAQGIEIPKTFYYPEGGAPDIDGTPEFDTAIAVTPERTVEAAWNIGGRVGILNFASASHPGGGVKWGSFAQEEAICRITNLYPALEDARRKRQFYNLHRDTRYTDAVLYSEYVAVLKTDSKTPRALDEYWNLDVVTCAAPNQREINLSRDECHAIFRRRINALLRVFVSHGNTQVVLGAFGCGAFRNPPEVVAKAFKDELAENFPAAFEKIVFAVYAARPNEDANYLAFKRAFT